MSISHLINYNPSSNLNIQSLNVNENMIINEDLQVNGTTNINNIAYNNILCNSIKFNGNNQNTLSKYNVYSMLSGSASCYGPNTTNISLFPIKLATIGIIAIQPFTVSSGSSPNFNITIEINNNYSDLSPLIPQSPSLTPSIICGNCSITDSVIGIIPCYITYGPNTNIININTINNNPFSSNANLSLLNTTIISFITNS